MSNATLSNKWLRLPGRLALLLGMGALSASGAAAASADRQAAPGDLAIRCDGSRVFLSENGGAFEPLALADTPEARHLLTLLQGAGAAADVRVGATILAGDGGSGFHWTPAAKLPAGKSRTVKAHGQTQPSPQQPTRADPTAGDRKAKG